MSKVSSTDIVINDPQMFKKVDTESGTTGTPSVVSVSGFVLAWWTL